MREHQPILFPWDWWGCTVPSTFVDLSRCKSWSSRVSLVIISPLQMEMERWSSIWSKSTFLWAKTARVEGQDFFVQAQSGCQPVLWSCLLVLLSLDTCFWQDSDRSEPIFFPFWTKCVCQIVVTQLSGHCPVFLAHSGIHVLTVNK